MFFLSTTKRQNKVKFCFLFRWPYPTTRFVCLSPWPKKNIYLYMLLYTSNIGSYLPFAGHHFREVKSIFLYSSVGGTQWVDIVHWTIHYRGSDFCLVGHIGAVRAPAPQNITLGNFHEHWPLSRTKIRKWGNCAVFRFMLWVRVEEAAEMSELSLIYLFVLPIVRKPLCESLKTPQKEF